MAAVIRRCHANSNHENVDTDNSYVPTCTPEMKCAGQSLFHANQLGSPHYEATLPTSNCTQVINIDSI